MAGIRLARWGSQLRVYDAKSAIQARPPPEVRFPGRSVESHRDSGTIFAMLQILDLCGTWKVRWFDGIRGKLEYAQRDTTDDMRYIDAQVPGEVHLDAWKAGWIQDPYVGTNCLAARWIEECIWSYRREFEVPADALKQRAWLVFEGLDCVATVVLNGQVVGKHRNTFYPARFDVSGKLREGKNVLAVHLDSGLYDVADKPVVGWQMDQSQLLHKRHWLRKPQCQFAWDWATRLINVGIFKPVRLEYTSDAVRADQFVPLAEVSDDLKRGTLRGRLFVDNSSDQPIAGKLTLEIVGTAAKQTVDVEIKPGFSPVETTVTLDNPRLWWPIGHGPQDRYEVRITLDVGDTRIAERSAKIGFRHVRVNQDPHPQKGRYFIIEINGRKIFMKGGNFVPADMIFARLDRQRYETLIDRAIEANFNMLRIWGGGLYESDDFYEICDARGILVWQEFIFACGRYPGTDAAFLEDIRHEARHQIRRLASRPSLVVWCGNNEMEQATWHWGFAVHGTTAPDYAIFHYVLPRIMREEDPTRYYQPSSPYSPDHEDPIADHVGDQHPWAIGFLNTDFRQYRDMACRFPNEGGILGPTALPTVKACLAPGHEYVQSFAWQVHDNSVDSSAEPSPPDTMVSDWIGKDIRRMSIEQYVYWAGLVQGEGLKEYIDNFRRRMFDTSSAIYWMYNDTWPAVRSWTSVDYYLRRTPSFWSVRRAMQPTHVVLAIEHEQVNIYGINESQDTIAGELRFGLLGLAGGYPVDRKMNVELKPNASTRLASFPLSEWTDAAGTLAFATLRQNGKLLARNRLYRPLFKEMTWSQPDLRVSLNGQTAVFESSTFAWGVCLDLDGETPLADNFFDVFPGEPYEIEWQGSEPPKVLYIGNLV
jgi:beta-mannosidase